MNTNNDYKLREMAGEFILIPTGEASQKLNGMINLTDTGAFIWKQVDTCENLQGIVRNLMEEYDVDEETATKDVYGFLGELYLRDMVQNVPELAAIEELAREEGIDLRKPVEDDTDL